MAPGRCVCPREATSAPGTHRSGRKQRPRQHTCETLVTGTRRRPRARGHGHTQTPQGQNRQTELESSTATRPAWGSQEGQRQPGMPLPPPRQKTDLRVPPAPTAHVSASRALQGPGSLPREDTVGDREPGRSRCTPSPSWVVQLRLCPPCLSFLLCLARPVDSAAPGSLPQGPEPRSSGGRRGGGEDARPAPTPPPPRCLCPKGAPSAGLTSAPRKARSVGKLQ